MSINYIFNGPCANMQNTPTRYGQINTVHNVYLCTAFPFKWNEWLIRTFLFVKHIYRKTQMVSPLIPPCAYLDQKYANIPFTERVDIYDIDYSQQQATNYLFRCSKLLIDRG